MCTFIRSRGALCPCIKKQPLENPLASAQRLALFLVYVLTHFLCCAWSMLWKECQRIKLKERLLVLKSTKNQQRPDFQELGK